MLLESLLECVNEIRDRIDAHGDALRRNETQTRYALIDPLLQELGWNTEDPALVVPEYRSGVGKADYALLAGGTPAVMVEAKSLDTPLQDVVGQGIQYCLEEGTLHFSVTDGRRWDIYETHRPVPIGEKRVVSFDLKSPSPAEVCLQALALWRPAVQSGHVAPGQPPVIGHPEDVSEPLAPPIPVPDEHEWQPLTEVTVIKGQSPVEILFPDGRRIQIKNWSEAPVEAVRWLMDKRVLGADRCPIIGTRNPKAVRYMVHIQPFHSNGAPFKYPVEVNGLYVEKHDNRRALVNKTKAIIEHVGQDPSQFRVRFT